MVKCLKCGFVNETKQSNACPECGIIYQKYKAKVANEIKKTFENINSKGLEYAREEFQTLATRFPVTKQVCQKYLSAIHSAVQETEKGNFTKSEKIFTTLLLKQPRLGKAVEMYRSANGKEEGREEIQNEEIS